MTKIVEISQVDYQRGLVKVRIPDRDNIESNWLSVPSFEYDMPEVNDFVRVSFDDDDYTNGICHGPYYREPDPPVLHGPDIFYKKLAGDLVIVYDSSTQTLEITAQNILINGDVAIAGNLFVSGSIEATGSITDAGGNTNHHEH